MHLLKLSIHFCHLAEKSASAGYSLGGWRSSCRASGWNLVYHVSLSYSGITRYHLNGLAKALTQRVSAEATYRSLPLRLDLWATDSIVIDHWSSVSLPLSWQGTSSGSLKLVVGILRIPPPNLRIHLARGYQPYTL